MYGRKKNLFISAGEIDLRFHCADESGNQMFGKCLGELLARRLVEISEMSCVDNVFYLMPLPPNCLLKNNQKYKGSFEARMAHYYDFVASIEGRGIDLIQLPFLEDKGNLPEEFLARDLIHLNQEGLNLVREDLKKYIGL